VVEQWGLCSEGSEEQFRPWLEWALTGSGEGAVLVDELARPGDGRRRLLAMRRSMMNI
jgi:hypothetical protein